MTLTQAYTHFIEDLNHVPGTQLMLIKDTLHTLLDDIKNAGITPLASHDGLIEEAGVAYFEHLAETKDCDGPEGPDYDDFNDYWYDMMNQLGCINPDDY